VAIARKATAQREEIGMLERITRLRGSLARVGAALALVVASGSVATASAAKANSGVAGNSGSSELSRAPSCSLEREKAVSPTGVDRLNAVGTFGFLGMFGAPHEFSLAAGTRDGGGTVLGERLESGTPAHWVADPAETPGSLVQVNDVAVIDKDGHGYAVGAVYQNSHYRSLIEFRTTGDAGWQPVPSPSGSTGDTFLNGVVALAPHDIWAAGLNRTPDGDVPFVLHYSGTHPAWHRVPAAQPPGSTGGFTDISAFGPTIIAVGSTSAGWPLVERFSGGAFAIEQAPTVGSSDVVRGVSVSDGGRAWAVGTYFDGTSGKFLPLFLHRGTGGTWSAGSPSTTPSSETRLAGVAMLVSRDHHERGVAVGTVFTSTGHDAVIYQLDTATFPTWKKTLYSVPSAPDSDLSGVDIGWDDFRAVGAIATRAGGTAPYVLLKPCGVTA
jgi:hypothetical protein